MIKEPYVIFSEIVDSLRTIGTITDVAVNASGKYLVTANNSFKKNSVVSITNSNLESFPNLIIFEADSVSFVVDNDLNYDNQYTYQYKSDAPYFMHEEEKKAHDRLAQKTSDAKWQKYPLVLLLHPYKVKYPKDEAYANVPELKIAIVNFATGIDPEGDKDSAIEKNSDQRYDDNFIPILDPIFDGIIEGIIKHVDSPVYVNTDLDYSNLDKLLLNDNPLPDLLDGKLLRINDFKIKYTCAAPVEVTKYQLKVSIVGDGETSPPPGTYSLEEGAAFQILSAENSGSEFVKLTVNTVDTFNRVFNDVMDGAKTAISTFQILLTGYYQDVMKGGVLNIVKDGLFSYFENVGTAASLVRMWIRRIMTLFLDGIGSYVDSGVKIQGQSPIDYTYCGIPDLSAIVSIFHCGALNATRKGMNVIILTDGGIRITIADGLTSEITLPTTEKAINGSFNKVTLLWSGLLGDDLTITINETAQIFVPTLDWVGDSASNALVGSKLGVTNFYKGPLLKSKLTNYFTYDFEDSQDVIIADTSGNGNHATLIDANLLQAWGTTTDEKDPNLFIYGYNKFQQIADPLIFVYKQYDINGVPTFTTLAGYNLIQSVAPNAGFSNTGSVVRQPLGDTVLNQVSQDYGLPFYGVSQNDPQDVTHAEFKAIDLGAIPPEDFRYTISNDVISNSQTKVIA